MVRAEAERRILEFVAQSMCRAGVPNRVPRVTGGPQILAHIDREPAEAPLVAEPLRRRFGVLETSAESVEFAERTKAGLQVEAKIDRRFQRLSGLRQLAHPLPGFVEARHGLAVRGQPGGAGTRLAEVHQRLRPLTSSAVVRPERRRMQLQASGVEMLERPRHGAVQDRAAWYQKLIVRY